MRLAVFAFTRRGCETAKRVRDILTLREDQSRLFTVEQFEQAGFETYTPPLASSVGPVFSWADALVFVGSAGIAVRAIAPHLQSKTTDPAVLAVDEAGRFIIPLLSGHIGGANALAKRLAKGLSGTAVLTTATDGSGRFSADAWAAERGLAISSMEAAKAVSAAILERDVPLVCEFPVAGALPPGVVYGNSGPVGIAIGYGEREPFGVTLRLVPRVLRLGIGCRRGTPARAVEEAVARTLSEHGLDRRAIRCAASIDRKAEEPGLVEFCRKWDLTTAFYTAEELQSVSGNFTPSAFVAETVGVDNVCERAACLGGHRLIVKKTALGGVTVALAAEKWEADFGC